LTATPDGSEETKRSWAFARAEHFLSLRLSDIRVLISDYANLVSTL
jgi:hypothetical protein